MPYSLPGEESPILDPITGLPKPPDGTANPVDPLIPSKPKSRLLFDKFTNGETKFTSLRYTDARDGFNKQMDPLNPFQLFPPTGYVGFAPDEKTSAKNHGVRISDFLRSPRGQKFVTKQTGLQLSNTRLEDVNLFSTTLNEASKKLGLKNDLFGGVGNINISPSTIISAVNLVKDITKNGVTENNILSAASFVARKQSRSAVSPLQNYNLQNTIDQAGTDPNTGWNHYDRFGATNIMSDNDKYWYIVRQNNGSEDLFATDSPNNRLVKLTKDLNVGGGIGIDPLNNIIDKATKAFGKVRSFANKVNSYYNQGLGLFNALSDNRSKDFQPINNAISDGFNFVNNRLAIADKFIAPFTNNVIDQYEGGPNSLNGIGPTVIKRYDNTNDTDRIKKILNIAANSLSTKRNLLDGDPRNKTTPTSQISGKYQDDTNEDLFGNINNEISNKVYNHGREKNYLTVISANTSFRPIKKFKERQESDKVLKYVYDEAYPEKVEIEKNPKIKYQYFGKTGKIINFDRFKPTTDDEKVAYNSSVHRVIFTPINPFTGKPFVDLINGKEDLNTGRILFDAYISNFKDNFSPTWNDINYIGRSETFHVFTKFKRDVSFTLQIPCFNPVELRNRHRALYELASINAGSYSAGSNSNNKLGGVITYLRLGNYLAPGFSAPNGNNDGWKITGEPGIITNFSITVPNDASWDIDEQLAHYLTVDVGFKLIHNSRPERQRGGFIGGIGDYLSSYEEVNLAEEQRKMFQTSKDQEIAGNEFKENLNNATRGVGNSLENFQRLNQITKVTKLQTGTTFSTSNQSRTFSGTPYTGEDFSGEIDSAEGYFYRYGIPPEK